MKNFKLEPKNLGAVLGVRFIVESDIVTGLEVGYEINYGELSLPFQVDIWEDLNHGERNQCQSIYNRVKKHAVDLITAAGKPA
ncbi:MAG: hypothetical protein KKD44_26180 [Proteobacteria bacterium]|nr:hypothetical protein [Patescibacteria group bacterium]MBU1173066.1 hypothetical protein [Pseudomonadota bacterium]